MHALAPLLLALAPLVPPTQAKALELTRQELAARDARVSFSSEAAERAFDFLELPRSEESSERTPEAQAAALVALGAGGSRADIPRFESFALTGPLAVRQGAIFGLADRGEDGLRALGRVARADMLGVEGALIVAALRAHEQGVPGARELMLASARSMEPPYDQVARSLAQATGLVDVPDGVPALGSFYELRWQAAKNYGLVDGKRYRSLLLEELCQDRGFLDALVLRASSVLWKDAVDDHVLEMVQADPNPARLRAAMHGYQRVLDRLAQDGWVPSEEQWAAMLSVRDVVPTHELEHLLAVGLDTAPETREAVSLRLLREGLDPPPVWMGRVSETFRPGAWLSLFQAAGDRGDKAFVRDLTEMLTRVADPSFVPHGWVALARLGHTGSREKIEETLRGGPEPRRLACIRALLGVAYDPALRPWLEALDKKSDLTLVERGTLALAFAVAGVDRDRALLRRGLLAGEIPPEYSWTVALALADHAQPEDLAAMQELFPVVDAPELNLSLAAGLLLNLDPSARRILRGALWGDDWNLSVLAGGLFYGVGGYPALRDEIAAAPSGLSEEKRRRVGYALGEFGGLPALERFARENTRTDERDPYLQGALLGALASGIEGE